MNNPILIQEDGVITIDCDDTLVMWYTDDSITDKIEFIDPYDGSSIYLKPHERHIKLLKDHKARGYAVIVWSAAGPKWANTVVDTLGLKDYVTLIMGKPNKYVDDLKAEEFMGSRIYLEDK